MIAISKKSGKKFTGKLAALMLRIGAATPVELQTEEVIETEDEVLEDEVVIENTEEAEATEDVTDEIKPEETEEPETAETEPIEEVQEDVEEVEKIPVEVPAEVVNPPVKKVHKQRTIKKKVKK